MVRISTLNDALKTMFNAEKRGKKQVLIRPVSKVIIKFLQVMQRHGEQRAGVIIIFGPGRLRVSSAGGACAAAPAVAQGSTLVKPASSAGGERASA